MAEHASPEQLTLRIHGRVNRAEEIGELVVREVDGTPVHVRDVARVEDGSQELESVAERNGKPTVLLTVRKQSGSNTVEVVDEVRARLVEVQRALPKGYSLEVVRDDSGVIKTSVDAVKEHLMLGALFAALVALIFLGNLRSTVIAAIAIPASIVGTFGLMWQQGFTLITITLLALALPVGIVIETPSWCWRTSSASWTRRATTRTTPRWRPPARSAWRSWPPRSRWSPSSCRWRSWRASPAASSSRSA